MITTGFWRGPCFAAAVCLFVALAPVQTHAQSDYDTVLVQYELTMAKVKSWEQASIAAVQALKGREDEGDEAADEDIDDAGDSLEEMAAKLDAIPEFRRAAHDARLSTREFATIGLVLFQAIMMDAAMQQNPKAELPKNMNPANLKFVQAHRAEVQQSFQAVQAATAAADSDG